MSGLTYQACKQYQSTLSPLQKGSLEFEFVVEIIVTGTLKISIVGHSPTPNPMYNE